MSGDRDEDEWDSAAEIARATATQHAIANSLVTLEAHPAIDRLTAATGTTAAAWATARHQIAELWQDYAAFESVVAQAGAATDDDEQLVLLYGSVVVVGRTVVSDGITGRIERTDRITLGELTDRMDATFRQLRAMLDDYQQRHDAVETQTAALAARLRSARDEADVVGAATAATIDALGVRLQELTERAIADLLAIDEPLRAEFAGLTARIDALADQVAAATALRATWPAELAQITADVDALTDLRQATAAAHARAREITLDPLPAVPADTSATLRADLAALTTGAWPVRIAAMQQLRTAVTAASTELTTVRDLATGLVERRSELRGRFMAYRAKAARLGRSEEPAVLALDGEVHGLLWARPCDLAAATRALAAYLRALGRPR